MSELNILLNDAKRLISYDIPVLMGGIIAKKLNIENPSNHLIILVDDYIANYNYKSGGIYDLIQMLKYSKDISNIINEEVLKDMIQKLQILNEKVINRMEQE
jgi:hypothetical protein